MTKSSLRFAVPLLAGVGLLLASASAGAAEATPAERDAWSADTRALIPKMAKPPLIDGDINPDEWAGAAVFNAQVSQTAPGRSFFPRDVAWFLAWDDGHLYLASRTKLFPNERPKRAARQPVGSTVMMDDSVELWIDPKGRNEGRMLASYFQGMVNALGVDYYSRLFPKIGARTGDWDPGWKIATKLTAEYMDVEIAMDVKGFDCLEPNKPGDPWGVLMVRNFMTGNWNQSPLAYVFPNFGFSVNSFYPLMTLADGQPFVRAQSPRRVMTGRAVADLELVNPGAAAVPLTVTVSIAEVGGKVLFEKRQQVQLAAGARQPFKLDEAIDPPLVTAPPDGKKLAAPRYVYRATVTAGDREIFHVHFRFDPAIESAWVEHAFPVPQTLAASAVLNPVRSSVEFRADVIDYPKSAEAVAARLIVKDAAGKILSDTRAEKKFQSMFVDLVQLPELAPGEYPWTAEIVLKDGSAEKAGEGKLVRKDEAKEFPWWNTPLGDAEKVLWPFTPVTVKGNVLSAWGKEMRVNGLGLPESIRVTGNAEKWPPGRSGQPEVLAGPMTLEVTVNGQPAALTFAKLPQVVSTQPHRIELAGTAQAGALTIATATRWEQDGTYFIDLTLAPTRTGTPVKVDSLLLRIPVRADIAEFIVAHGVTGHGGGYVIKSTAVTVAPTSPGPAIVWTSRDNGKSVMAAGDFIPQVWLGNEFRGLLWYTDNDRGWTPSASRSDQQVVSDGTAVTMCHALIIDPVVIAEPRVIRFVLQPTPMRPLEPSWRMLNQNFSQSFLPWSAMGRSDAAYSAMINLPNDAAYAKSREFVKSWLGPKAPNPALAMYFAPHTESSAIMTSDWAARGYFGGEWEGGTYTKTLNDHTLWYVNKWVEAGGLQGIYHDQFAPHTVASISAGLAYLLPDGRVQPGYALTTRRNYVMREHALWLEKGYQRPRTLTHTTNGGPMGSYGWIESCIDGEDKQINSASTIDFADCWPTDRIRAATLTYNFGCVMGWMRLIDKAGMTPEQSLMHDRVFVGHCLMHDITGASGAAFGWDRDPNSPLLKWGLERDDVFFWPFWRNADVVKGQTANLKVSVWTRPDRILLCIFNYDRQNPANGTLALDLAKLGVTLPAGAVAVDLEKRNAAATWDAAKAECRFSVGKRDYLLIGILPAGTP